MGRWRERVESLVVRAGHRVLETHETVLGRDLVLRVEGHRPFVDPDHDDAWLAHLIAGSSTYFDLGTSVGAYAVLAALDPARRVVALDTNTRALQVCAANLVANGLSDRVTLLVGFLGDTDEGTWDLDPRLIDPGFAPHPHLPVPRRSLDGIVAALGVAPDLIKLDIEGGEAEALRGAVATADEHHPRFVVEMHATGDLTMVDNGTRVLDWCASRGYEAWYLAEHAKVTTVAPFAERGRCHLLLQPAGEPYPAGLDRIPQGTPIAALAEIPLSP
jgi:FkbM family methyltransferase